MSSMTSRGSAVVARAQDSATAVRKEWVYSKSTVYINHLKLHSRYINTREIHPSHKSA